MAWKASRPGCFPVFFNTKEWETYEKDQPPGQGDRVYTVCRLRFSMMSVFIRLAGDVPTAEKAFFRNIVALAMVGVLLAVKRVPLKPEKGSWPFITGRAVFGTIGLLLNFYAVDHLVLADANMLNKLSPFFAIIFSVLLLREKPTAVQIGGVLTALLGSVLIIKPGFEGAPFVPSLAGFISGAAAGLAYTFVRKLGARGENSLRIVFYFSLFSTLLTLPFFLVSPVQLTGHQLLMLLLCGCSACVGQFGITQAYLLAPAKEISVYDYSQILFAAGLGYLFFRQIPDGWSMVGYILICGAGVGMFLYNKRRDAALNGK